MQHTLPTSRIHRASVTHCELNDDGPCTIGEDLLDARITCKNEPVKPT